MSEEGVGVGVRRVRGWIQFEDKMDLPPAGSNLGQVRVSVPLCSSSLDSISSLMIY